MEILWIVLAPFFVAPFAPLVVRAAPRLAGWFLGLLPAALFVLLARHVAAVGGGAAVVEVTPWVPEFGILLAFRLDGFGLLFALLISGIGALVVIYAGRYLQGDRDLGRFYVYLLLFMGSMLGVVLADDLIALFVFWELTSLTSFFLIGYHHGDAVSQRSALQALLVTGAGGLALLAGSVLLWGITGTTRLSEILTMGDLVRADALYVPALILVLGGAFTKSAQFPFHFWLPNAMAAPSPVSAYLHSATMVKAGVYLLARMNPVLGGTHPWLVALVAFGGVTMVLGAYLAFRHTDFKLILAYTTLSALGTLVLLIGIGTAVAIKAAVLFLVAHALYKGALFLVAGVVDHATGTRDVTHLGGLAKRMPITAGAAVLAGLSLAGIVPLFAFIAKEALIEAAMEEFLPLVVVLAVALTGMLFVAVAGKVVYRPFFGAHRKTPRRAHDPSPAILLGPVLLALAGLLFGVVPRLAQEPLLAAAAGSIHAGPVSVHLELWHGITPALLVSVAVVLGGILLYLLRGPVARVFAPLDPLVRWGPEATYHRALIGLQGLARWTTSGIQTTHLRRYLLVLVLVLLAAAGTTLSGLPPLPDLSLVPLHEAIIVAMMLAGALLTATARSRLTAIISLGLVGYGVALLFVLFGAPDLALTQFLFETLIVLLFMFVLLRMPTFTARSTRPVHARDAVVGIAVGLFMATVTLFAVAVSLHEPISGYFADNSYVLAHGHNVVNVILVDFRGLDTLGEITVVAVAGTGAFALLSMRRRRGRGETEPTRPPEVDA